MAYRKLRLMHADRGYVMLEGQQIDNVKGFYKNVVGGRAGVDRVLYV